MTPLQKNLINNLKDNFVYISMSNDMPPEMVSDFLNSIKNGLDAEDYLKFCMMVDAISVRQPSITQTVLSILINGDPRIGEYAVYNNSFVRGWMKASKLDKKAVPQNLMADKTFEDLYNYIMSTLGTDGAYATEDNNIILFINSLKRILKIHIYDKLSASFITVAQFMFRPWFNGVLLTMQEYMTCKSFKFQFKAGIENSINESIFKSKNDNEKAALLEIKKIIAKILSKSYVLK